MEEFFYALKRWEEYFGEMSRVVIYSDGSGHVEDENKDQVFSFQDIIDFVNSNPAEIYNAQQSVYTDPPSACEDCGSVDEHIHYANCPLANTAGR